MSISVTALSAIVIGCLIIVTATPALLLYLWFKDWKRKSLW